MSVNVCSKEPFCTEKIGWAPPSFFKNLVGAAVGDIHMTILMTAKENGLEPVQYLADLLEFSEHLNEEPSAWLPWNYENTVAELRATKSTA